MALISACCAGVSWSSGMAGRRIGPILAAGFFCGAFLAGFFFAGMGLPRAACLGEWRTHTLSHSPRRWPTGVAAKVDRRGGDGRRATDWIVMKQGAEEQKAA